MFARWKAAGFALLVLATLPAVAQPPATPAPSPAATPTPADARKEQISAAYKRATGLAKDGDHAGAMKAVEEFAAQAGANDPFTHELRGTVLALAKDYAAAQKEFELMLDRTPSSHIGRFNLAEMIFLQTRYEEAEKQFSSVELLTSERDPAVADLCRYKRVICRLAQGNTISAELLIPHAKEEQESPALTYSRAAIAFRKGDAAAAAQAIADAATRFPEGVVNLYTDSLIELKWGERDPTGKFQFKAAP